MNNLINIYKDVITSELCDELIALHNKEKEYTEKEVYDEDTNVKCYNLDLDDYPEHEQKVFEVVEGIIDPGENWSIVHCPPSIPTIHRIPPFRMQPKVSSNTRVPTKSNTPSTPFGTNSFICS